jgi:hypothetical protein
MESAEDQGVEILFRFYSDLFEQDADEVLWADVVDEVLGHYRVLSIPYYAPLVATEDIILARHDEKERMLVYEKTIENSGNSTVQVILMQEGGDINKIRKQFEDMGCISEALNEKYFAMEVPADLDYTPIRKKLEELESAEIIGYAEPCLSDKHNY